MQGCLSECSGPGKMKQVLGLGLFLFSLPPVFHCGKIHITSNLTVLTIINIQFSGIKCVHRHVQYPPSSISRILSVLQTGNCMSIKEELSMTPALQPLVRPSLYILLSVSEFGFFFFPLKIPHLMNHAVFAFAFLSLAYFT